MSFIRPDLARRLNRWRETLAGLGASSLGAVWMIRETGALAIVGTVLAVGGALLVFAGIQRARFRQGDGGPGIVQLDEGQLTYFGPHEGGSVVIEEMLKLELDASAKPEARWVLTGLTGEVVSIPVNAQGAEGLFDVFAGLPGLRTEDMLRELQNRPDARVVIWDRAALTAD